MSTPTTEPVQPRLSRQKEAGLASREETRRRLVAAAGELFLERGYAGTTVTEIADRAGVSLQTLYLAGGSKRALLQAFGQTTLSGSPTALTDGRWVPHLQQAAQAHRHASAPVEQLRAIAHVFREIAERAGTTWRLYRDAAAVDADANADLVELERLRRLTFVGLLATVDPKALRAGLSMDDAVDTALVVASPNTFEILVTSRGYDLDAFEGWVARTLVNALLADSYTGTQTPAHLHRHTDTGE